jgi:hypothetical protein
MKNTKIEPLADAVKQFEHWRTTRTKRGTIPTELLELAKSLKTQYGITKIAHALKINCTQLKNHLSSTAVLSEPFIECPVQSPLTLVSTQGISLSFHCKNGLPVTFNGLQASDIASIIAIFMGEDMPCFN